jgi:hypothetical protein
VSVWLAFGLIVGGLIVVAIAILITDIARGDVGGGRHTMARARRLLVIALDPGTREGAERWIAEQREKEPDRRFFLLDDTEGEDPLLAVEHAIDHDRPDAIVVARPEGENPRLETGVYGALKEERRVPVDAIYVSSEART